MKFYFNCNNNTQADILREAGVKNVFLNYKYVKSNLDKISKGFESILLSPSLGVDRDEYNKFIEDKDILALQLDYIDPVTNWTSFKNGREYKDNLIPVFHGNYMENLRLFKDDIKEGDIIALGKMKGTIEEDEMLRRLPATYQYHGLGKGRWVNKKIHSVDSSTWLSGVRGRKTDVFRGQQITFGKKGLTNKSAVQAALKRNQKHLEMIGLKEDSVLEGDYNSLMKVTLAVYYMPMFESLGILDDNFILK